MKSRQAQGPNPNSGRPATNVAGRDCRVAQCPSGVSVAAVPVPAALTLSSPSHASPLGATNVEGRDCRRAQCPVGVSVATVPVPAPRTTSVEGGVSSDTTRHNHRDRQGGDTRAPLWGAVRAPSYSGEGWGGWVWGGGVGGGRLFGWGGDRSTLDRRCRVGGGGGARSGSAGHAARLQRASTRHSTARLQLASSRQHTARLSIP
jgi:hypothetical protein